MSLDRPKEVRKKITYFGFILFFWPVFKHFSDLRKDDFITI